LVRWAALRGTVLCRMPCHLLRTIMDMQKVKEFVARYTGTGTEERPRQGALEILKYIGPGLIVTVGFIDPGNWAANVAAGSEYGYRLLWMVSLSTLMLIMLQHNVAHLGIVTGRCLSEAATIYLRPWISKSIIFTAVLASISTALAEIMGAAIGLNMLFNIPIKIATLMAGPFIFWMLFANGYKKIEKWIIGFVSLIGLSFLYELTLVHIDWHAAARGWIIPSIPPGSIPIIMSVLGAVVMPHNLFLHSEIIQSRQWNLENDEMINRQLKYEFADTLFSMMVGWAINSAMILLAAAAFYATGAHVTELAQAREMLHPLLGRMASVVFAAALLLSGLSSSVTAGMAGGSIFVGLYGEPYDIKDRHTRLGVGITLLIAMVIIFFISDPFKALIYSQIFLSIQLPITVFLQIYLTSSRHVMGKYANTTREKILLWIIALIVSYLNIMLLLNLLNPAGR
jgi:manganese transport protein